MAARGWRMWGRISTTTPDSASTGASTTSSGRDPTAAGKKVAGWQGSGLTQRDDLRRPASWPSLAPEERARHSAPYAVLAHPPIDPAARTSGARDDDAATQAWLADLVAPILQPEAAAEVRAWFKRDDPTAHLYAVGSSGCGRTSVVLTCARQAMARRPAPVEYCYVPDPTALTRSTLLTLPSGTAVAFADALTAAWRQISLQWEKPRVAVAEDSSEDAGRRFLIAHLLDPLLGTAPEMARAYLRRLQAALDALLDTAYPPQLADVEAPAGRIDLPGGEGGASDLIIVRDGTTSSGAPVVIASLARMDLARALLRANGGVLVLSAADLVDRDQPNAEWAALRAILRAGSVAVRGGGAPTIPLAVRVALVGSYAPYRVLERAEDFLRLFRFKARFDDDADWTPATEAAYAALADGAARRFSLPPLDLGAIGRLVEEGARRASGRNRTRLCTDVLTLRDLVAEAGDLAAARRPSGGDASPTGDAARESLAGLVTTAADIEEAVRHRRARQGAQVRKSRADILAGYEIVPTTGGAIGQINGLGVVLRTPDDARYAIPLRVTAAVSPGRERLVDIEREAQAADTSHVLGGLTMAGYLAWRYGGARPISVVARLRFEQDEYTSGPSASAAELFALLSALAEVPIRRSLAVTGAVGQHGEIQTIGGANDKIEGFWEICRQRRALGDAPASPCGVLIPAANAGDLMLRADVAESIASEGWFSVWPITTVDDGLALLTGLAPADIHARVDRRLRLFYELAASSGRAV